MAATLSQHDVCHFSGGHGRMNPARRPRSYWTERTGLVAASQAFDASSSKSCAEGFSYLIHIESSEPLNYLGHGNQNDSEIQFHKRRDKI
jgi:hypothetical protein